MRLDRAQRADNILYFILLEKADASDANRSALQARCGVCQRHATKSKHRNLRLACFVQGGQASGLSLGLVSFLEDRSKDGEVRFLRFGATDFGGTVARGGDQKGLRVRWTVSNIY
jgi:hypothetical protein